MFLIFFFFFNSFEDKLDYHYETQGSEVGESKRLYVLFDLWKATDSQEIGGFDF